VGYRIRVAALLWFSLGFAAGTAWQCAAAAELGSANPEDGSMIASVYENRYFAFRYPLPPGWTEGPQAPRPSTAGYYVLSTPTPPETAKATILLAAQDMFFAAGPIANAHELVNNLARSASEEDGTTLDASEVTIAGRPFTRVEARGTPLSRIVLATDIRCHVVIFTFTGAQPERLNDLEGSLHQLSFLANEPLPRCVRAYATPETILRKVDPAPVGPRFLKIPVRIIIGADGTADHIHVIRAFVEQRKTIEDALARWQFKPYRLDGQPAAIETGLVFELGPAARH
jgi:hypothetical protein